MSTKFSSGKHAIAQCDRCSFRFKLTVLKRLTIRDNTVNIKVCPECWEPDHPQLKLGKYPVQDPQAVRDPRPDTSYPQSRDISWGWAPLLNAGAYATGAVGTVRV
jgi:hypothetical protein